MQINSTVTDSCVRIYDKNPYKRENIEAAKYKQTARQIEELTSEIDCNKDDIKGGASTFVGSIPLAGLVSIPFIGLTCAMYKSCGAPIIPESVIIGAGLPGFVTIVMGTLLGLGRSAVSTAKLLFNKVNLKSMQKEMSKLL